MLCSAGTLRNGRTASRRNPESQPLFLARLAVLTVSRLRERLPEQTDAVGGPQLAGGLGGGLRIGSVKVRRAPPGQRQHSRPPSSRKAFCSHGRTLPLQWQATFTLEPVNCTPVDSTIKTWLWSDLEEQTLFVTRKAKGNVQF